MTSVFTSLDKPLQFRPGMAIVEPARVQRAKAANVRKREARFGTEANPWALSGAEMAVLRNLMMGNSQSEAGKALFMASKTVATHVARAREKMGARTAVQAAVMLDRFDRQKPVDMEVVLRIEAGRPTVQMRELTEAQ